MSFTIYAYASKSWKGGEGEVWKSKLHALLILSILVNPLSPLTTSIVNVSAVLPEFYVKGSVAGVSDNSIIIQAE